MFESGVLLSAGFAVGKRDRTEVGTRAVRILAAAQSSPHAGLNPVHLFEPGLIECLCCRHLLCGGGSGRLSFGLRAAVASLATAGPAFALLPTGRRRRRSRCTVRWTGRTWLRLMLHARTGLQSRRHVLAAEGDFIKAVGARQCGRLQGFPAGMGLAGTGQTGRTRQTTRICR